VPVSLNEATDAALIERWQRRGDDAAREALVHRYRGLVRALAARYVNWGEPFDDLVQVAWIGLLKAIERFDSERGVQFPTYATPTIVGEIRRYYRDRAWAVHVPRSVQELRVRVNATIDQWSAEHGEAPTTAELATFLDVSPDAILDAIHSENARSALALPSSEDDRTASGFDVPTEERGFDQVDASLLLAGGLDELAERERQIVAMRFEEGLTQSQIAARIGISQMHVSRLLRRALSQLRAAVGEIEEDAPGN
jgi:RNA polymerase sigma-B factor